MDDIVCCSDEEVQPAASLAGYGALTLQGVIAGVDATGLAAHADGHAVAETLTLLVVVLDNGFFFDCEDA